MRRLVSILIAAGGWLLVGIRTTLDLIGLSTAPDDVDVAVSRLDQFFLWFLSVPWWAPWGFALVSTLALAWASVPSRGPSVPINANAQSPPVEQVIRLVQETKVADGRIINIRPGDKIQFDCNDGWNFYFELTQTDHMLVPPLNPKEGSYRLYIVQRGGGEGLFSVSAGIRWAGWGSDFSRDGDLSIYEIDILAGRDGFEYIGRLLFDTGQRVIDVTTIANDMTINGKPTSVGPTTFKSIYKEAQVIMLDSTQASSAILRASSPEIRQSHLQIQFCVTWHSEEDTKGTFTLESVRTPMDYHQCVKISLDDTAHKRIPKTSPWSESSRPVTLGYQPSQFRLKFNGDDARAFVYSVTIRFLIPGMM